MKDLQDNKQVTIVKRSFCKPPPEFYLLHLLLTWLKAETISSSFSYRITSVTNINQNHIIFEYQLGMADAFYKYVMI